MFNIKRLTPLFFALGVLLLSGCGQSGALYLPEHPPEKNQQQNNEEEKPQQNQSQQ